MNRTVLTDERYCDDTYNLVSKLILWSALVGYLVFLAVQ